MQTLQSNSLIKYGENEQMTVKERLINYLDYKRISKTAFGRAIGVSSSYITSMRKSIQPEKLQSIALNYPDLNIDWLLTGDGEMLKPSNRQLAGKDTGTDSISLRIEQIIRELFGDDKQAFAKAVGIEEADIKEYLTSTKLPKSDTLEKIVAKTAVSSSWLLTGEGSMTCLEESMALEDDSDYAISSKFPLRTDRRIDTQTVPLYDLEASAGLVALFGANNVVPADYISLPNLPPVDGAVHVRGDSMYPLLKSGDIVLYKEVTDYQYGIFWGEMYLVAFCVDGEEYIAIKYIQKSELDGHVRLVSYNPHHSPKDIPVNMIRALALVKASVRYNTMG